MQSSHPNYITSRDQVKDPETGQVIYDREVPIPWADAVKYGLVAEVEKGSTQRSRKTTANRARHHEADTAHGSELNRGA